MSQSHENSGINAHRLRIIALGDELITGVGDAKALGWLGRVVARSNGSFPIDIFPLGVPGETTAELGERWERELQLRLDQSVKPSGALPEVENRVVLGPGRSDIRAGISLARSRLNLAKIIDGLETYRLPVFVVGPPPSSDASLNARIRDLSGAYADVCERRQISYIDTVNPLLTHEQWHSDLAVSGHPFPGQAGYGLIAWLVLHGGFQKWLGISDETAG